jgi:hypothetical protein
LLVVSVDLKFPEGAIERWLALPIDSSKWTDWWDGPVMNGESEGGYATVGELFAAFEALATEDVETFLDLSKGEHVIITAGLDADIGLDQFHQDLATAIRSAHEVGAHGTALFLPLGLPMAVSIEVTTKGSKLRQLDSEEALSTEARAKAVFDISEWMTARSAKPGLTRAAYRAADARFWLPETVSDAEAAALAAASALADKPIQAALRGDALKGPATKRARKKMKTADDFRTAAKAATPEARMLAVGILATADFEKAEPLASAMLGSPSAPLVAAAARALSATRDPAVFQAMLLAARPGLAAVEIGDTMAGMGGKKLDAFLLEKLDSPLLAPDTYKPLAPGFRAHAHGTEKLLDQLEQTRIVVNALTARGVSAAVAAFERIFLDPSPGALVLRPLIVESLVALGGKPMVKKHKEAIELYEAGMGLALNADAARRAAILGIELKEGIDYTRFGDLSGEQLDTLVEEGFIDEHTSEEGVPTPEEFLELMDEVPEATVRGYAVGPHRPDYRVSIDGVACDLSRVEDVDRREEIREALTDFGEGAVRIELDGDSLLVSWQPIEH